jgi:uncharacterized protein YcgI (DUF1989 family)
VRADTSPCNVLPTGAAATPLQQRFHRALLSEGRTIRHFIRNARAAATVGAAGLALDWERVDWYGWDEDGAGVHDVIGTRCDLPTGRCAWRGEGERP